MARGGQVRYTMRASGSTRLKGTDMADLNRFKELPTALERAQPAWDAFTKRAQTAGSPMSRKDEQDLASLFHDFQRASLEVSTAIGWRRPIP